MPISGLAQLTTAERRPLAILDEQDETRLSRLVPLRRERMALSPFTFYRGTAALMAADLARDPHSGLLVASCGDAHVSNFGFYASRQRKLVFDLNDFDEAAWAPWEWDLKRLVASVIIAGQSTSRAGRVVRRAAEQAIDAYVGTLARATELAPTDRYFAHFDLDVPARGLDKRSRAALETAIADARKRTGLRAARKLTGPDAEGRTRLIERPPTTTHVSTANEDLVAEALRQYQASAAVDIRLLLRHYAITDLALRVVGVGSVGTRCYLALLHDGDDHSLLLQIKEAGRSVLEQYGRIEQPEDLTEIVETLGHGARVVAMQRTLQATSDPFLGYIHGSGRDYYVRQFHDMKGGIDMDTLEDQPFVRYATACGTVLARAHAQSPTAAEVVGYIGKGKRVRESLLAWCTAYATLSRDDYDVFVGAADARKVPSVQ